MEQVDTKDSGSSKLLWSDPPPAENQCWQYQHFLCTEDTTPNEQEAKTLVVKIGSKGEELIQQRNFTNALWKYENMLSYCKRCHLPEKFCARALLKCCEALVMIVENSSTLGESEKMQCIDSIKERCDQCLALQVKEFAHKVHYWLAEAYRLLVDHTQDGRSHNVECALTHYELSFVENHQPRTLLKAIIVGVNYGAVHQLQQYSVYLKDHPTLLKGLLEEVLECTLTEPKHVDFLFGKRGVSGFLNKATYSSTQRLKPSLVYKTLIKCLELKPQIVTPQLLRLLIQDQTTEDYIKQKQPLSSIVCAIIDGISTSTSQLLVAITKRNFHKAIATVDSKEIFPYKVNLSDQIDDLLWDNGELLEKLLVAGVNPQGHTGPHDRKRQSPIDIVCRKCSHPKLIGKVSFQTKGVRYMHLLLKFGANVEDLKTYHHGSNTSPLHVATQLALITGNKDFLQKVTSLQCKSWVSEDKDGKSPLQIAELSTSEHKEQVLHCLRRPLAVGDTLPVEFDGDTLLSGAVRDAPSTSRLSIQLQDTTQEISQPKCGQDLKSVELQISTVTPDHDHIKNSNTNDAESQVKDLSDSGSIENKENFNGDEENSLNRRKFSEKVIESLSKLPEKLFFEDSSGDKCLETISEYTGPQEISKQVKRKPIPPSPKKPSASFHQIETFDKLLWEIDLDERVKQFLCDKSQQHIQKQVLLKLRRLGEGLWNKENHKQLKHSSKVRVYEVKVDKGARILYQILVRLSYRETEKLQGIKTTSSQPVHVYTQMIVVRDIVLDHDKLEHAIGRIAKLMDNVRSPARPKPLPKPSEDHHAPQLYIDQHTLTKGDCEEVEKILKLKTTHRQQGEEDMCVKTYPLTTSFVLGVLNEEHTRIDFPIKATDEEYDVITMPENEPVVVLGRSGTGKTTTCLNRLWIKFTDYWNDTDKINNPSIPHIADIIESDDFTEQQLPEANAIELATAGQVGDLEPVPKPPDTEECTPIDEQALQSSAEMQVRSETEVVSKETHKWEHLHQVFITKSKNLCKEIKQRFCNLLAGHPLAREHLVYCNKDHLPDTLPEVDDLSYPLFITAKEFFIMVDRSLDSESFFSDYNPHDLTETNDEIDGVGKQKVEVTASLFQRSTIGKRCRVIKADPLLVWMEIQSFIKGSRKSLTSPDGELSEEEYLEVGQKQASNFPLCRKEVYKLYREYKADRRLVSRNDPRDHFDNGDFMYHLHKRLQAQRHIPWSIHRIYIDEVQDFTQAELSVIAKCCADPNGFFLTGDTAQSIVKGVSFRFEDLVSMFYEQKEKHSYLKLKDTHQLKIPRIQKLTINHRSHVGVTSLASTVTDLLKEFFPHSFDWHNIKDDISNIEGPKPVFLSLRQPVQNFPMLRSKPDTRMSSVEFGADQAIIIRDEEEKKNVPPFLQGLVLKVHECKGLEFNGVLMYNFFTHQVVHSPQQAQSWRASATYLRKINMPPSVTANLSKQMSTHSSSTRHFTNHLTWS